MNPCSIRNCLNFTTTWQVDKDTGDIEEEGMDDEYQLEELEVMETFIMSMLKYLNIYIHKMHELSNVCTYGFSLQITPADYFSKKAVTNFKNGWESLGSEFERVDEYDLGTRESLNEAVQAVINIFGLQPCEVTCCDAELQILACSSRF